MKKITILISILFFLFLISNVKSAYYVELNATEWGHVMSGCPATVSPYQTAYTSTGYYSSGIPTYGCNNASIYRGYLFFNLSKFEKVKILPNATLRLAATLQVGSPSPNVSMYEVYNDLKSQTWNNQTCGISFNNSVNCNLTAINDHSYNQFEMYYTNVYEAVKSNPNLNLFFKFDNEASEEVVIFRTPYFTGSPKSPLLTLEIFPFELISPQNTTYNKTFIPLNVSNFSQFYNWWYWLNSGSNMTFTPNTTIIARYGSNQLIVYANDTYGKIFAQEIFFSTSNYLNESSVLNEAGMTYYLTADLINVVKSGDWQCYFSVCSVLPIRQQVILDCQNHIIDGTDAYTTLHAGIYGNNLQNVTIKNCVITDFGYGIYFVDGSNNTIVNINTTSNNQGMLIQNSNYNNITNIVGDGNALGTLIQLSNSDYNQLSGIISPAQRLTFDDGSNYNRLTNSKIGTIRIRDDTYGNVHYNNTYNQTTFEWYDGGVPCGVPSCYATHFWNTTVGNIWTNSTHNGYSDTCLDWNMNGVCDFPYLVNIYGASGNNTDWLPVSICPQNWTYTRTCFNTTHYRQFWHDNNECYPDFSDVYEYFGYCGDGVCNECEKADTCFKDCGGVARQFTVGFGLLILAFVVLMAIMTLLKPPEDKFEFIKQIVLVLIVISAIGVAIIYLVNL